MPYTIANLRRGARGMYRAQLLKDGVLIAEVHQPAVVQHFIPDLRIRWCTPRCELDFVDACDCITPAEAIESMCAA